MTTKSLVLLKVLIEKLTPFMNRKQYVFDGKLTYRRPSDDGTGRVRIVNVSLDNGLRSEKLRLEVGVYDPVDSKRAVPAQEARIEDCSDGLKTTVERPFPSFLRKLIKEMAIYRYVRPDLWKLTEPDAATRLTAALDRTGFLWLNERTRGIST